MLPLYWRSRPIYILKVRGLFSVFSINYAYYVAIQPRSPWNGGCTDSESISLGSHRVQTADDIPTQTTPHLKATHLILLASACGSDIE